MEDERERLKVGVGRTGSVSQSLGDDGHSLVFTTSLFYGEIVDTGLCRRVASHFTV